MEAQIDWFGEVVREKLLRRLFANAQVTGAFLERKAKQMVNRGQPTKRVGSGGRRVGLDPSKPGEPPKKIYGQLQNSIRNEVVRDEDGVVIAIGSNLKKARWLELGTSRMAERPFLRPTILNNKEQIDKLLRR